MSDQWTGHPWTTVDHRPISPTRASCAGCGEICTPHCGCPCCSESAYEWSLAERDHSIGWATTIISNVDQGRWNHQTTEWISAAVAWLGDRPSPGPSQWEEL